MTHTDLVQRRLYSQRLAGTPFEKPEDVVRFQGAVQSQDYAGAKWALGLRLGDAGDADVERAFNRPGHVEKLYGHNGWEPIDPEDTLKEGRLTEITTKTRRHEVHDVKIRNFVNFVSFVSLWLFL